MNEQVTAEDLRYLRSSPSRTHSFARFVNSTKHVISLVWIDYQGKGVIYMDRLMPRKFIDVNTFVGHKWVFFRTDTKARLVGNQSTVYKPQPWQSSADPGTQTATRQIVLIQEPVYTLWELCLTNLDRILAGRQLPSGLLPAHLMADLTPGAFFKHIQPFIQPANPDPLPNPVP